MYLLICKLPESNTVESVFSKCLQTSSRSFIIYESYHVNKMAENKSGPLLISLVKYIEKMRWGGVGGGGELLINNRRSRSV